MTTTSSPIRILTVDDHPLLRDGVSFLIGTQPDMKVVAEASEGIEALEQFRLHRTDVVLMDLRMPGMSGIDAMIAILGEFPQARTIVLTTYSGDIQIMRALKAGAKAYLLKGFLRKEPVWITSTSSRPRWPSVLEGLVSGDDRAVLVDQNRPSPAVLGARTPRSSAGRARYPCSHSANRAETCLSSACQRRFGRGWEPILPYLSSSSSKARFLSFRAYKNSTGRRSGAARGQKTNLPHPYGSSLYSETV
jgi:CheY-like chemotaxis protein